MPLALVLNDTGSLVLNSPVSLVLTDHGSLALDDPGYLVLKDPESGIKVRVLMTIFYFDSYFYSAYISIL